MRLSIIIPVYNEENTIVKVLEAIEEVSVKPFVKEVIIVDDGSSENTAKKIQHYFKEKKRSGFVFLQHKKNQGKGSAIHTGMKKATGDYILIQDADLEYNPKTIPMLLEPIIKRKTQVVYGTRLKRMPNFLNEEKSPLFFMHFLGNRFLSLATSILYGQWLTDMETGYKIFPRKALSDIKLESKSFDFEPEITAKLLKKGYTIIELPIVTEPRGYDKGKKLYALRDGTIALWKLLKYRFVN